MGAHYGSIHFQSENVERVLEAVRATAKRKKQFLVAPARQGWVRVYPSGHGQDDAVSRTLAKKIGGVAIHLILHDDDVLYYFLYRDGKLIDSFSSDPDYFGEVTPAKRRKVRGKPDLLRETTGASASSESLGEMMEKLRGESLLESELPQQFAGALGLIDALVAYEDLISGETDEIQDREHFVEIPPLSEQRKAELQKQVKLRAEIEAVRQSGVLLFPPEWIPDSPFRYAEWKANPIAEGFFTVRRIDQNSSALIQLQPPWTGAIESITNLPPDVRSFAWSNSGRFLCLGFGPNAAPAQVMALADRRPIASAHHERGVGWCTFSDDESFALTLSTQDPYDLTLIDLHSGAQTATTKLSGGMDGAIHSSQRHLVVGGNRGLSILELPTLRLANFLCIPERPHPEPPPPSPEAIKRHEKMLRTLNDPEAMKKRAQNALAKIPTGPMREQVAQGLSGMLSKIVDQVTTPRQRAVEQVLRVSFDSSGEKLLCLTHHGLRVYRWNDLMGASEVVPPPIASHSHPEPKTFMEYLETTKVQFQAMSLDSHRRRILFGGDLGVLQSFSLNDGRTHDCLTLPTDLRVTRLTVSNNGKYVLCNGGAGVLVLDAEKLP